MKKWIDEGKKVTIISSLPPSDDKTTGSNAANRKLIEGRLEFAAKLPFEEEELLFDPQTSGGLLLSLPGGEAENMVKTLREAGVEAAVIVGDALACPQPGLRLV